MISLVRKIKIKKIINAIKTIKSDGIKSILMDKKEYLLEVKPKKSLWKFFAFIIVIIVILGIIGYLSYSRNKETQRVQQLINPIQTQVISAKEKVLSDPIVTREIISESVTKLEKIEQENQKSSALSLVVNQKQELIEYLDSISGREELQDLDVFYDLRLAKSDYISSGIDMSDKKLVLFDKEMKEVLLLDYDSKKVSIRDFSNIENLKDVVITGDNIFTLDDGIHKYDANLDAESELVEVRNLGDSNKNATLIESYDRFVYVINPEKRNIYRYSESDEGYSDPVGWMKSATGLKYDELTSISVDGDVWLTTIDGQLKKFTSGREETLNIRGLDIPFEKDIFAYTNEKLNNVYVLDPSNNRVVSLSKNGDFIKEYKSVSLGAASNLAVNEELNKIFVVSGSIIYQINL